LKARILFVLPNFSAGGAERNILTLVRWLAPDFEVHLALIRSSGKLLSELPDNVRLHALRGRLQFPFQFIALARRLSPCIVFSTIVDVNLAVLAVKRFLPHAVRLVMRDAVMPLDLSRERWYAFISRYVYGRAYANADVVIVLTERCRHATIEKLGVSEHKVHLIRNAVSEDRIGQFEVMSQRCQGTIELVSVGRLERQKGYDLLIRSLPKVVGLFPNVKLTIYGDGKERSNLERDIDCLNLRGIVTLAGHVSNPTTFVSRADLYVLCSRYEGMSNSMLEALYCGTPVLAANNPENSAEEFILDGKNGFLVPTCSVDAIEHGLLRALGEYCKLDREWIQRDARDRFSFERYLQSYTELIERACEREPD
jgi:glycosyltransferase involved in cell wall biosynthesis